MMVNRLLTLCVRTASKNHYLSKKKYKEIEYVRSSVTDVKKVLELERGSTDCTLGRAPGKGLVLSHATYTT